MGNRNGGENAASGTRVMVFMGGLFSLVGLVMLALVSNVFLTALASKSWPMTPGEVLSAGVSSEADPRSDPSDHKTSTTFRPNIRYTYSVEGTTYEGNNLAADDYGTSNRSYVKEIAGRYKPGEPVTVYYDPQHPEIAVLETGPSFGSVIGFIIGTVFTLGGCLFMLIAWREAVHRRRLLQLQQELADKLRRIAGDEP